MTQVRDERDRQLTYLLNGSGEFCRKLLYRKLLYRNLLRSKFTCSKPLSRARSKSLSPRWLLPLLGCLFLAPCARAHVGSKDVFEEAAAGPYRLFVTVRPPVVIPGVAQVEVRVSGASTDGITVTQLPLTGEASLHPPTPDAMQRSRDDPNFYTGGVWMMLAGSMQVRFAVSGAGNAGGAAGTYLAAVPVPAQPLATLPMQRTLALTLAALGLLLVLGLGGILGAAAREGKLKPGAAPTAALRRRGWRVAAITIAISLLAAWLGGKWWGIEAASFAGSIYHPLAVTTRLTGDHLRMLVQGHDAERKDQVRSNADFIPDHGKIMHLYAVREPGMDAVFHLHPWLAGPGDFELDLPAMPAGRYKLLGDVVHANGFPETLVSTLDVPEGMPGRPLDADDAAAAPPPLAQGLLPATDNLPDGYAMVWDVPARLTANTAYAFHFTLLDPHGKPPAHMQPYLGMAGHAAFLKTDGTVFAHVHPEGSAAMAAMMMANAGGAAANDGGAANQGQASAMGSMPGMAQADLRSNAVEFPYGFPAPGRYRIFVQMKHDATVETGTFDAVVP